MPAAFIQSIIAVLSLALVLGGCSQRPLYPQPECQQLADRFYQQRRPDPFGYPLTDFDYLRTNRTLAALSAQLDSPEQYHYWHQLLYQQGYQARQLELDNLSQPFSPLERQRLERCIEQLAEQDIASDEQRQRILSQGAEIPDSYRSWQRALGLFPLTRLIALNQIEQWQQRWGGRFNDPDLLQGSSRLYRPPESRWLDQPQIAQWLDRARVRSPLALPVVEEPQLDQLFDHFAPLWQLYQQGDADLPGAVVWHEGLPTTDPAQPTVYRLSSYTRFEGQWLLQLNYLLWLPERAAQGSWDLYAGRLDGLLWRVTLDTDGSVLVYDSIHPCGCYHRVFPVSPRLQRKPLATDTEQPLIIDTVIPAPEQGRLKLQLLAGNHYLQGIGLAQPGEGQNYEFASYHQLRSLAEGGRRRGLFDPDGLVSSSRRLERWLLWPMGVPSPGAMRVWGQHAISFADKRYFDQVDLLEQFFSYSVRDADSLSK